MMMMMMIKNFPFDSSLPKWLQYSGLGQAEARSQELILDFPHKQQVSEYLDHSMLHFQVTMAGSQIGNRAAGARTCALIQDADVTDGDLTRCTTAQTPKANIFTLVRKEGTVAPL